MSPDAPGSPEVAAWRPRVPGGRFWAVVLALLGLHAALALDAARDDAATYDETAHLPAGWLHLRHGDFRVNPEHPPLAKAIGALGMLALDVPPLPDALPALRRAHQFPDSRWLVGYALLFGRPDVVDGGALLWAGRVPMVALSLLLLALIATTARTLLGPGPALAVVALAALEPTLLGHGHLVNTDVPLTLALLLASLAAARLRTRAGADAGALLLAALLLGVACGLAALTKFSALPWLGTLALWLAVSLPLAQRRMGTPWPRSLARTAAAATVVVGIAWAGVWLGYGLRFAPSDDPGARLPVASVVAQARDPALLGGGQPRLVAAFVEAAHAAELLPEAYLFGLGYATNMAQHRRTYLLGAVSEGGDWRYFPVALLTKLPLGLLALVLLGLGLAARSLWAARGRERADVDPAAEPDAATSYARALWVALVLPAAVLLAMAVAGRLAIGLRHLLPIWPAMLLLAGLGVARLAAPVADGGWRGGRAWLIAALAAVALSVLANHPHHLAYFHEIAGGRDDGDAILVDSNLDWGQDLGRLGSWMRDNGIGWVNLAYFGTDEPRRFGVVGPRLDVGSPYPLRFESPRRPGVLAISVSALRGLELDDPGHARVQSWLRGATELGDVGGSIRLYALPPAR